MAKFPDKCSRCGAPISWKEGASSVECDFCGNINYSRKNIFNFNISKNKIIYPIKDFLINKKILNTNQIDYINDKTSKLFEKRLFRLSILLIFISTPIVIYKSNKIDPKLINICEKKSQLKSTDFASNITLKNCLKRIKLLNYREYIWNSYKLDKTESYKTNKIYFNSAPSWITSDEGWDNAINQDIKSIKNDINNIRTYKENDRKEVKEKIRLEKEAKAEEKLRIKKAKAEEKLRLEKENIEKLSDEHLRRGEEKHKLKDFKGAISEYTKTIKLGADLPAYAYEARGHAKHSLEDYKGAISDYTKALNFDPDTGSGYGHYIRGLAKIDIEDYKGAISDFTYTIKKIYRPFSLNYYYSGIAKYYLNDYKGAVSDYTKAINLDPDFAAAYNNRGYAKTFLKDYKGAATDYTKAINLYPDFARTYYIKRWQFLVKKELELNTKLIRYYKKVIKIDPDFAPAYLGLAIAKNHGRQFQYSEKYRLPKVIYSLEDVCSDLNKASSLGSQNASTVLLKLCNR